MPDCIVSTGRCSCSAPFVRSIPWCMVKVCAAALERCPSIVLESRGQSQLHTDEPWACPGLGEAIAVQQGTGQAQACIFSQFVALSLPRSCFPTIRFGQLVVKQTAYWLLHLWLDDTHSGTLTRQSAVGALFPSGKQRRFVFLPSLNSNNLLGLWKKRSEELPLTAA